MEQIIQKIIDIDKEAVNMEESSKKLIEKKQDDLRKYFKDIEEKEDIKADKKIKKETRKIEESTLKDMEQLEMKKEKKIGIIKNKYKKSKKQIIEKSIDKILQL